MTKLCIVGMACAVGGDDLDDLERTLYAGESGLDLTAGNAVQPEQLTGKLVAQLLGDRARDLRIATVVCGDDRPEALARRVADQVSGSAQGVPVSGVGADNLVGALALASGWLEDGTVDLTCVVNAHPSAALLVSDDRPELQAQAYAVVESSAEGCGPDAALAAAQLVPTDIRYLETTPWPPVDALVQAYRAGGGDLTCAVGSLDAGSTPGAAMVALIKAVLCVSRRMLLPTLPSPALRRLAEGQSRLDLDTVWEGTPFYTVSNATPWFSDGGEECRVTHVAFASDGGMGHVFLSQPEGYRPLQAFRPDILTRRTYLVPVVGDGREALLANLEAVRARLADTETDVAALAAHTCRTAAAVDDAPYALSLVGRDREELLKESGFATEGIAKAFDTGKEWQTPKGSCFTAKPLGPHGVTFVYPGVFNSYVSLGRDLFQHFPWLHDRVADVTARPGSLLSERGLYPRARRPLAKEDVVACMQRLHDSPMTMIESGAAMAIVHTLILQEFFGVQPRAAMGYSMGELSMFWSAGVWQDADAGSAALHQSALFSTMISGPRTAVKAHWGMGPDEDVDWATYLLKAKVDKVREAVAEESRVFVTFVNLANEVVIAGDEAGCRRVIAALDCHALPVPASVAIHNEAIHDVYDDLVDIYTHPVVARPEMTFYSAASYDSLELDEDVLADAMATMCCQPVDFPRLVSHVYDEGARVFVELGPLATCTRRIKRILRGKDHMAVALNPSPGDDLDGVMRTLAALVAHRVPVDLSALYGEPVEPVLGVALSGARYEDGRGPARGKIPARADSGSRREDGHGGTPARAELRMPVRAEGGEGKVAGDGLVDVYAGHLLPQRQRAAQVHDAFLQARSDAQARAGSLISLQIEASRRMLGGEVSSRHDVHAVTASAQPVPKPVTRPAALFDEAAVQAFASGDVTACFGSDFEIYRDRRLPRIPNGDLLMMGRVMEIEGEPGTVAPPATLRSEFDVPEDVWFYEGAGYPGLPPNVVLMEMALQPCGFLSAYLRSSFLDPAADFYFRNLDGRGRVLADMDLRGKTVCDEVRLLSSIRGQGAIIQTYEFTLSCEGKAFYEGWSSFGYFPQKSLARQAGLGAPAVGAAEGRLPKGLPVMRLAVERIEPAQLQQFAEVRVAESVKSDADVWLSVDGRISPEDWFFRAHFFQDPVMPGSLGVEAAFQAMVGYARWRYPQFANGVTRMVEDCEMVWKYRGQITPEDRKWRVAVQLTNVRVDITGVTLSGNASLWKDDVRIYQIDGIAVSLTQQ